MTSSAYGRRRAALKQDQIFRKCPRCMDQLLHPQPARNAVTRHDNETLVCSGCGRDEALRQAAGHAAWPGFPEPWTAFASRDQRS